MRHFGVFFLGREREIEGAAIVSKSASFWAEEGEEFVLKGTVKEHGEYKGEAQTIVQRVTIKGPRAWEVRENTNG